MADVFVSYARADKARVAPLVAAVEAHGWSVWWDPEIAPGQEFDDLIDTELAAAKSVLVVWTPTSVASRWVRGEARDAADRGILVPVRFDQARLPIDVRAIHTTDLDAWNEDASSPVAQECLRALAATIGRTPEQSVKATTRPASSTNEKRNEPQVPRLSVCVLPFANLSGDSEQEYFSDGITEDITTDLSKVSALSVASSNNAFMYKGQHPDIQKVTRDLKVSHVLEGSVRKAGERIRINAQLIDGSSRKHIWAERYDRDASDIFAIQDEISEAIVKALKLRLLPKEKKAIERRDTDNAEAYNLYLKARQTYVTSLEGDERSSREIVQICIRAIGIDPHYAEAWALMATGYRQLRDVRGGQSNDGMNAVERALALSPDLAAGHAVKAQLLQQDGDPKAAERESTVALELDRESYEVNRSVGRLNYRLHKFDDAIRCYEKAAALMEADINSATMLISCYTAVGDAAGTRRAAELTLKRADAALARDPDNSAATACSVEALAALGEAGRTKSRMKRALAINPDNWTMRYNFACMLCVRFGSKHAALKLLGPVFEAIPDNFLAFAKIDPDLSLVHDDPRFQAMVAAAEARLAVAADSPPRENQQTTRPS